MMSKVDAYLSKRKEEAVGDEADLWQRLEDVHSRKQWHELANLLKEAVERESFVEKTDLAELYHSFIHEFEHRLNRLTLTSIVLRIARAQKDLDEGIKLMENLKNTVKGDEESVILSNSVIAGLQLQKKDEQGRVMDIAGIRDLLEETQEKLEALGGVSSVTGEFHRVQSVYLREIGDFGSYYKEALRYLGCTDLSKMSETEKQMQAFCLGLAALLGEDVYNFGELLAHEILQSLNGTDEEWLVDLLFAFNAGDLTRMDKLRPKWSRWDDLKKHSAFLEQKIRLLAVMELAFARSAKRRSLSFEEVAQAAQIPVDAVEKLLMKTLSKGLLHGAIDQVEGQMAVSWVQPRVLDKTQIGHMAQRMDDWSKDVGGMERFVHGNADEILTR